VAYFDVSFKAIQFILSTPLKHPCECGKLGLDERKDSVEVKTMASDGVDVGLLPLGLEWEFVCPSARGGHFGPD
jgi:hypothetical protein